MTFESHQLPDGITRINLAGRMDIAGTEEIDLRFTSLISGVEAALVDLSGVSFLSSIGIRTLITNAKTLKQRGGLMVLLWPQPLVAEVLQAVGVGDLIPVFDDEQAAMLALKSVRRVRT